MQADPRFFDPQDLAQIRFLKLYGYPQLQGVVLDQLFMAENVYLAPFNQEGAVSDGRRANGVSVPGGGRITRVEEAFLPILVSQVEGGGSKLGEALGKIDWPIFCANFKTERRRVYKMAYVEAMLSQGLQNRAALPSILGQIHESDFFAMMGELAVNASASKAEKSLGKKLVLASGCLFFDQQKIFKPLERLESMWAFIRANRAMPRRLRVFILYQITRLLLVMSRSLLTTTQAIKFLSSVDFAAYCQFFVPDFRLATSAPLNHPLDFIIANIVMYSLLSAPRFFDKAPGPEVRSGPLSPFSPISPPISISPSQSPSLASEAPETRLRKLMSGFCLVNLSDLCLTLERWCETLQEANFPFLVRLAVSTSGRGLSGYSIFRRLAENVTSMEFLTLFALIMYNEEDFRLSKRAISDLLLDENKFSAKQNSQLDNQHSNWETQVHNSWEDLREVIRILNRKA